MLVGGRYELHDSIATGGMARVHLGRQLGSAGFARTVAIKRLHPHLTTDHEFATMFVREAQLAARIRHPNVVTTLDVAAEEGELFLVMEYVHGESLAGLQKQLLARQERLPPRVSAAIIVDVLRGLHAAHEAQDENGNPLGIVHRDISPHNILVGLDGTARVADFGVAKALGSSAGTGISSVKGKLAYLAPEQAQREPVTRVTDVYATSIVFWELLTGSRLIQGASQAELVHACLTLVAPPVSSIVPGLTREFDDLVARGLSPRPEDRFPTARDMLQAIERSVGCAGASEVGTWVERIAGTTLSDRAELMRRMEQSRNGSSSTPVGSTPVTERRVPEGAERVDPSRLTLTTSTSTSSAVWKQDRSLRMLQNGLLFLALSLLGLVVVRWLRDTRQLVTTAAPASPPSERSASPVSSGRTVVGVPMQADSTAASSPPALVTPPPRQLISDRASPARARPAAKEPAATEGARLLPEGGVATGRDCTPPYTVNEAGVKLFKFECM